MKRQNAMSVGEIIDQVLREARADARFDEHHAVALWPQIVGPGINAYTLGVTVKNGVMTVQLKSAALRNELMMSRSMLCQRINEALGHEVIREILLR